MNLLKNVEQLNLLHGLLCSQKTGSPGVLCRRLGMSRSKLYVVMGALRERGAAIAYSRERETYYYENDFRVDIVCRLGPLRRQGLSLHRGEYRVLPFSSGVDGEAPGSGTSGYCMLSLPKREDPDTGLNLNYGVVPRR